MGHLFTAGGRPVRVSADKLAAEMLHNDSASLHGYI